MFGKMLARWYQNVLECIRMYKNVSFQEVCPVKVPGTKRFQRWRFVPGQRNFDGECPFGLSIETLVELLTILVVLKLF